MLKKGSLALLDFKKPENLDDIEEFFWLIKGRIRFDRNRIADLIPKASNDLIEKETLKDNMIVRNR